MNEAAQQQRGISITGFLAALSVSATVFLVQIVTFLVLLRVGSFQNVLGKRLHSMRQLATRFWPSTPTTEKYTGNMDAHYFLQYLNMILSIFQFVAVATMPLLLSFNFLSGRGHGLDGADDGGSVVGLDTLAFGNIRPADTSLYAAHAAMAVLVVFQFCRVVLGKSREFVNHRQEWLQQQKHYVFVCPLPERLRADGKIEDLLGCCRLGAVYRIPGHLKRTGEGELGDKRGQAAQRDNDETREKKEAMNEAKAALIGFRNGSDAQQAPLAILCHDPLSSCAKCSERDPAARSCPCSSCSALTTTSVRDVLPPCRSSSWLEDWARRLLVTVVVALGTAFWGVPVTATAALGQIDNLVQNEPWLSFVERNKALRKIVAAAAGVLPGLALSLLLYYVLPISLDWLARVRGASLVTEKALFVQRTYFIFLFIQMVLVVSVASFFTASLSQYLKNVQTLGSVASVSALLARNLPTAANYFFSYLTLQALSKSSGILLQPQALAVAICDKVRRRKERRHRVLVGIAEWACEFPFYVTLACIGLVYCIIAPLISVFVLLCFYLILLAKRYSVQNELVRIDVDYGGILYPTAVQQTFVGLYLMLVCLCALFMGVRDEKGLARCVVHGVVMILLIICVAGFQFFIYRLFEKHTRLMSDEEKKHANSNFEKEIEIGNMKIADSLRCCHRS